jgi:tetratricopeptide (TPR) repeat protein
VRPYAAEHLGSVYVEQGRFREAVEMYEEAIAFCRHTDTRHLLDQIPLLKQLEATAHQKYDAQRREAAARGMESTLGVATVCVDRTASRHSRKAPQVEVAIGVQSQL